MRLKLLYFGIILCLESTSPNGATIGKKPVLFFYIVILEQAWTLSPPFASVHRPELQPRRLLSPQKRTLASSIIRKRLEKVPRKYASRWFLLAWNLRFRESSFLSEQTEWACACMDGRHWGFYTEYSEGKRRHLTPTFNVSTTFAFLTGNNALHFPRQMQFLIQCDWL